MRSSIKKDYNLIIKDHGEAFEIKYSERRNDYNKDLHFRIMTDMDMKFDTSWRMIRKPSVKNLFGFLASHVAENHLPEYDIIFYLHGGGFLANTSEAHSDYLRR
jgi:acetyl esterase/lipase